jgi:superfamily II DNA or RNA helicase
MLQLNIEWGAPYKVKTAEGCKWQRNWSIPEEYRNGFFAFWSKFKFKLKEKGYGVYKKGENWYLSEIKSKQSEFEDFSLNKPFDSTPHKKVILFEYKLTNSDGLREWQIPASEKLISSINYWNGAIDGSDLGTGKTYTACGVIREINLPFVVVCPKPMINKWNKVIRDHFKIEKNLVGIINYELLIKGRKDSKIASYIEDKKTHRKRFVWKIPENSLIIWDEAHRLKNFKTKNSKTCIAAYKQKYKMLFLSATIASSPLELRTIGTCFKLFTTANEYYKWLENHGCSMGFFGMQFNNDVDSLKKINRYLFDERGVRLKRDLIPNFPETEIIVDSYNLDDQSTFKINEVYAEMRKELKVLDLKTDTEKSENELTIRLRALQKTEILKVPLIEELVRDGINQGMNVAVFLNFSDSIDALATRLNTQCIFDGRFKKTRDENLNQFQLNSEKVIICNSGAAREGLDFGDSYGNHPRLSIIAPTDSSQKLKQIFGRVCREDSKTKSIQLVVYVADTAEEDVVDNVNQKLKNMSYINNSDLTDSDLKIN